MPVAVGAHHAHDAVAVVDAALLRSRRSYAYPFPAGAIRVVDDGWAVELDPVGSLLGVASALTEAMRDSSSKHPSVCGVPRMWCCLVSMRGAPMSVFAMCIMGMR